MYIRSPPLCAGVGPSSTRGWQRRRPWEPHPSCLYACVRRHMDVCVIFACVCSIVWPHAVTCVQRRLASCRTRESLGRGSRGGTALDGE